MGRPEQTNSSELDQRRVEERTRALDQLLLFVSSMFGIFISLLQPVMDGTEFLFFWLPLVFLGTFMPLWIGYWRGAIVLDSNLERARGWEYLLGGVGACLASEISLQVWIWAEGVGIPPLTLPLVWLGCTVFVFVLVNYPATRFLAHVIRAAGIDAAGEDIRTTHDRALKLGVAVSVISIVPQRVRQYFGNTLTLEMVAFLALTFGVPVLYGVWKIVEERRSQQQTQPVTSLPGRSLRRMRSKQRAQEVL